MHCIICVLEGIYFAIVYALYNICVGGIDFAIVYAIFGTVQTVWYFWHCSDSVVFFCFTLCILF